MLTLVHEDIYVYIDKIQEQLQTVTGTSAVNLSNDARGSVVDQGVIEITINSGSYTAIQIGSGFNSIKINKPLSEGDIILLDLRDRYYTHNDVPFFLETMLDMRDDTNHTINVAFTGTGAFEINYRRNLPVMNNNDLFFCTGLDVSENSEIAKRTNIKAQTKLRKTAKKDYTWSINGLWNDTELNKFESDSGMLRLRLVDESGMELEKLSNCVISSFQKSSSDSGDLTYSLNGSLEKIF